MLKILIILVSILLQISAQDECEYRLPKEVVPSFYELRLKPLFDSEDTVEGEVVIRVTCQFDSQNITLHSAHNQILSTEVFDSDGHNLTITSISEISEYGFLVISLDSNVQQGGEYTIKITFNSNLRTGTSGFYKSTYVDENGDERTIAATHFSESSPFNAHTAFPCFDEAELRAVFRVSLGRREDMTSATATALAFTEPQLEGNGWFWDHFEDTVNMPTYILAFLISDFTYKSFETLGDWSFGVLSRASVIARGDADYAGTVGPKLMKFFEEYYNIPYPMSKSDQTTIPDFAAGAMENWGLVKYRERLLLFHNDLSSAEFKQSIAVIIGHELAHMWFGNLVTPAWWSYLWLSEGFATYLGFLSTNNVEPTWSILNWFVLSEYHVALDDDSLENSRSIFTEVCSPSEVASMYDTMSYNKAGAVIRMTEHYLTEDVFVAGLQDYLVGKSYEAAVQDELFEYLNVRAENAGVLPEGVTVKQILDTWTLQMGYPVITVLRDYDTNEAIITQKRFLQSIKPNSTYDDYSWWIPITFTNNQDRDFTNTYPSYWIQAGQQTITIQNVAPTARDWIIFNIQETGFYRVNYDNGNWLLLTDQLVTDHTVIPPLQRAQIIDDVMDIARAGHIDYSIPLLLARYLQQEQDYYPLAAGLNGLNYIYLMFYRTEGREDFKNYMQYIITPSYELIDYGSFENRDPAYPDLPGMVRNSTIVSQACKYSVGDCREQAQALFGNFRDNYDQSNPDDPNIQVSPDLKSLVYCQAIELGTESDWDFLWNHYLATDVASERNIILYALGCSAKPLVLNGYLEKLIQDDSGIRSMDTSTVFSAVANTPIGRPIAWNFLTERTDELVEKLGNIIPSYTSTVSSAFNTQKELEEMMQFLDSTVEIHGGESRTILQAIERVQANIVWMDKNYEYVHTILQSL